MDCVLLVNGEELKLSLYKFLNVNSLFEWMQFRGSETEF